MYGDGERASGEFWEFKEVGVESYFLIILFFFFEFHALVLNSPLYS